MKRKVMLSLFVIFLAAAIIGGATMAWFSDTAESEEITFQAGTLLIGLEGPDFEDFAIGNLNPGDKWCSDLWVVNDGTKNMKFRGCLFDLEETLGNVNHTGLPADYGTALLSEVLQMTVFIPTDSAGNPEHEALPNGYSFHNFSSDSISHFAANRDTDLCCDGEGAGYIIYEGSVEEGAIFGEHWEPNNPFTSGEAIMYKVCFHLPGSETGNEYQGSSISGKFGFSGAQWLEEVDYPECGQQED